MQGQKQQVVYLIHFDSPYYHARHYLGTTTDLEYRLRQHQAGVSSGGARLMEVIIEAGISWRVAAVWQGSYELEKRLKAWNNSGRFCPICKAERIAEQVFTMFSEQEDCFLC